MFQALLAVATPVVAVVVVAPQFLGVVEELIMERGALGAIMAVALEVVLPLEVAQAHPVLLS
jgi:hypothetical protein